jgi:hypothetical protein
LKQTIQIAKNIKNEEKKSTKTSTPKTTQKKRRKTNTLVEMLPAQKKQKTETPLVIKLK